MATAAELCRRRPCLLVVASTGSTAACSTTATPMALYLSRPERPLAALLARDRLRPIGNDRFTYHSRPLELLGRSLVPHLTLEAHWNGDSLLLRSLTCRIEGLGSWGHDLGVTLEAALVPREAGVEGWVQLCLCSPLLSAGWARGLAGRVMEALLDRIERRMRRGLRADLEAWLVGSKEPG
jgi:hypothetical protein